MYWAFRHDRLTARQAQRRMAGLDRVAKEEALAVYGPAFEERPRWQRYGVGIWYETVGKPGYDPRDQSHRAVTRRRLRREAELPVGAEYRELVAAPGPGAAGVR